MKAIVVLLLLLPAVAYAATAHWTGAKKFTKSASGRDAISCEYDYAGNKFWQEFLLSDQSSCPATVEAQ